MYRELIAILSIVVAVLSVLTSFFIVRRVKKLLSEMSEALADVKSGNGNRRILSETHELTAPIAYEINDIVMSYENRIALLHQTEEQ